MALNSPVGKARNAYIESVPHISSELDELTSQSNISENIYKSLDYLLRCAAAIVKTDGEAGWSAYVTTDAGTAYFSPSEQSSIESAVAPLVPVVLYLFGKRDELPTTGGAADEEAFVGIDGAYDGVVKYLSNSTDVVRKFGREHGIIHMLSSQDDKPDLMPFGPTFPVPPRAAFTLFYLALDVTRMLIAVPFPGMRKVMSIMLAIIDIMRGEWKQALLSFAGFYGDNPMLAGVFGKVMLESFNLISPALKDSMIYGFRNFIKSLAFGLILFGLQTFSPFPVRVHIIDAFRTIQEFLDKETAAIAGEKLVAKPSYFRELSFAEIQNLQPILADTTRICSNEIQTAIYTLRTQTIVGRTLLELMNIPVTDEGIMKLCRVSMDKLDYIKELANNRVTATQEIIDKAAAAQNEENSHYKDLTKRAATAASVAAAAAATAAVATLERQSQQVVDRFGRTGAAASTPAEKPAAPAAAENPAAENPARTEPPAGSGASSTQSYRGGGLRRAKYALLYQS